MRFASRLAALAAVLATAFAWSGHAAAKDIVIIKTSMGDMTAELYPDIAPQTVANFKQLAKSGFYNGVKFHRIMAGFMVQTGDPNSRTGDPSTWGTGGSGHAIPGEFTTKMHHTEGVLSMARTSDPNSATSQFFICLANTPSLDGQYAIFGKVTRGLAVLRKIGATPVKTSPMGEKSLPIHPPIVKSIIVKSG